MAAFTLLEILVALAVVSIGLLTLIQLHLNTIRLTEATAAQIQAAAIAETRLATLAGGSTLNTPLTGFEEYNGQRFQWTLILTPCPPESFGGFSAAGLQQAAVEVTWPRRGGTGSLTLWRTLCRPEDTP